MFIIILGSFVFSSIYRKDTPKMSPSRDSVYSNKNKKYYYPSSEPSKLIYS